MSSIVKIENITKEYHLAKQVFKALRGVSIQVDEGELVAIMGPSGAGKSTLMNIIGLLDTPTSGKYFLTEHETSKLNDNERSKIRNQHIGFVFQGFFLLPKLNALENVLLPTIYREKPIENVKEHAMNLLAKVGMEKFYHHKPHELSGGQQQRVAIARSLVCSPSLILADEPTGALDSRTSDEVLELFHDLNQRERSTIIIVTHDNYVGKACQRIIRINDGLVEKGEGG